MNIIRKLFNKLRKIVGAISDTSITDDHDKDKIPKRSGNVWVSGGDGLNNFSARRFKK